MSVSRQILLWAPESSILQFSSVQSLSCGRLFATPWTAAHQVSLSITNTWSLLKLMSIEWVTPPNHVILCHPLFLWPSILPSIRIFSNGSVRCIRWPKYWSFSFSISPSNEYSGLKRQGAMGPSASQLLSLCSRAWDCNWWSLRVLQPVLCNERSPHTTTREKLPFATIREKPEQQGRPAQPW